MTKQKRRSIYWIMGTLSLLIVITGIGLTRCATGNRQQSDIAYYTCPMHPQIRKDTPGQCPICGMTLVPVKKDAAPAEAKPGDTTSIEIDPHYTQRIGVATEAVATRDLSKTIRVSGKVAHDPELWVVQNEYLQALKLGDSSLVKATELKLQFLGLSPEWIKSLKSEKQATLSLHLPTHQSEYVEAYVYPSEANDVKPGEAADIYDESGKKIQSGTVSSIASILDMETRTMRVLVHLNEGTYLKPNTFIQVAIHIPLGNVLAVPKSAILFNGDRNLVYVAGENGRYTPVPIALGREGGEYYEVKEGVHEGDEVVTNGHFLIDSETQIRLGSRGHNHS